MVKSLAIAASLALATAAARAGEPGGTPDTLFFGEAAVGGALGVAFFVAGYAVGGDPKENEGTSRENASYVVYGAAPLASALGVYLFGETVGQRSANRGVLFLATAGTFYGLTGAAAGTAYALTKEDKEAGALNAAFYAIIPAGFAGAAVYNALKRPYFYEIPGYSIKVGPSFTVCRTGPGEGGPIPIYGVSIHF
ncbi:MAG: hypothetical protein GTN49_11980 [candidate division Zixibacteria bacterium]|nr:hypothetical protein [candidate division Zixibacteria bacterium]